MGTRFCIAGRSKSLGGLVMAKKGGRLFTDEVEALICAEYNAGESSLSLARKHGCSVNTVIRMLGRHGINRRQIPCNASGLTRRKLNHEQERELCKDYELGVGSSSLGKKYGVAETSVIDILKRNKIKIRTRAESLRISPIRRQASERSRLLTPEQEQHVVSRYLAGKNMAEIVKESGYSKKLVSNVLKRANVQTRSASEILRASEAVQQGYAKRHKFSPETEQLFCDLYRSGKNATEIANDWPVSLTSMIGILRRNGVEVRPLKDSMLSSLLHVLANPETFTKRRTTYLYVTQLKRYPRLKKVGIAFCYKKRARDPEYGRLLMLQALPTRMDAFLIEQAILRNTKRVLCTPDDLRKWCGATEIRNLHYQRLEDLFHKYYAELVKLDYYEFARAYLPLKAQERGLFDDRSVWPVK